MSPTGATVTPYSPLERETPAGYLAPICPEYQSGEHTMTLPVPSSHVSLGNKPRTRMNDDHSMHIPGISSHRNVNNSRTWPGTVALLQ